MVMQGIISVERVIAASNADFLAGTQLDQPGRPGVYTVFVAADAAGNDITISLGGQTVTDASSILQRTNSEIRENEDGYYQMLSTVGGRPVINITRTAGNIRVRVKFLPA